uniref:Uncharacterized protein n=1 Tax=Ditylenchus dipsaci TaxID=166011 RepID=A0A915E863_9BILA
MSLGSSPSLSSQKKTLVAEETAPPPDIPHSGMIKTYSDTSHRTFSRPYSAKTVFFYKDGDEYFTGVRVPISKARYRTMNSLMDSLNHNISLPFGVRRLHTPFGRTNIESIEQLKHLGRYVASSTKTLRKVNFESALEQKRLRNWRPHFSGNSQVDRQTSDLSGGAASTAKSAEWTENEQGLKVYKARMATNRNMGVAFLPITAKQMFFVLNGHPTKIYRTLINPLKRRDLNSLLEEVSEGLHTAIFKLYSYGGERIVSMEQLIAIKEPRALAVPRNEKPNFNGQASSMESNSIERQIKASKLVPPSTRIPQRRSSLTAGEKARRPVDSLFRLKQSSKEQSSIQINGDKLEEIHENSFQDPNDRIKLVKKAKIRNSDTANGKVGHHHSLPSSSNTIDSDSGRPRSTDLDDKSSEQQDNPRAFFEEQEENEHRPDSDDADITGDEDYPEVCSKVGAAIEHARNEAGQMVRKKSEEERLVNIDEEEDVFQRTESEANLEEDELGKEKLICNRPKESNIPEDDQSQASRTDKTEITPAGELELLHSGEPEPTPTKAELSISPPASGAASPVNAQELKEERLQTGESNLSSTEFTEAATKIQKNWRGYAVRKNLKRTQFSDDLEMIHPGDENDPEEYLDEPNSFHEDMPPDGQTEAGDEDINQLLGAEDLDIIMEKRMDSGSDREEVHGTNYLIADKGGMLEPSLSNEMLNKKPAKTFDVFTYSITIITGNRWAADTEADLYLTLYGDLGQSERLNLCQEYVNWLQSSEPKFRQNQSDTFQVDVPTRLGVIGRLTVGHEHTGYGAGIFIDRILVTEESDDEKGRQFLFLCNKWLDSGQVDGKIERSIRLSAFYDITSIPMDNKVTKGRWELIIHSGNSSGEGGTTSNLNVVGYGTRGHSKTTEVYDSRMAKVPSESLIQVDFGDIGELLKIRLEVDGSGDSPDYFLNFVELKDLDTEEQFAVMCGKWLRWKSTDKGLNHSGNC